MKISVLIVGIGGFGGYYVEELLNGAGREQFRIAGAVEPYVNHCKSAEELRRRGIPVYRTLEEFYQEHRAELAVLVTPTWLHAGQARYCMEHGSDVLCEKPLCASLEDAASMTDTRDRTGRRMAVGFQWSFDEAILKVKQDIMSGLYGKIHRMRTIVCLPRGLDYYRRGTGWAGRRRLDTGEWILDSVASNAAAHYLHNMLFLCGSRTALSAEPERMEAEVYRANPIEMFDTCALRIYTVTGVELLFYATHAVPERQLRNPEFILEGEKGNVFLGPGDGNVILQGRLENEQIINYDKPGANDFRKLYCMREAILENAPLPCVAETALPHLKCICGLAESFPETPPFPEKEICYDEKANQYICAGLGEALDICWKNSSLPWEEGVSWAQNPRKIVL